MKYERLTTISLRNHQTLTEAWVQDRIAEDPSILGLGELVLKERERQQPRAGRLDLLLRDLDGNRRYEVEIQLGKTDESHIIRTIEYWDIERRRFPVYDHVAVLVAEDITSRFLNVVSLFNGAIPLIAIQMRAVQLGDKVSLVFTTVLDKVQPGREEEEEESAEATDRNYWETKSSKATVAIADELMNLIQQLDPRLELKFNKFYIGLAKNGQANNFVTFRPLKTGFRLEPRLPKTKETDEIIEAAGLDLMDYDSRWGRYRIRLAQGDTRKHQEFLHTLLKMAFRESEGESS